MAFGSVFFNSLYIICTINTVSVLIVPFRVHGSDVNDNSVSTYIVHTDSNARPFHFETQEDWHSSMMESVVDRDIDSFPPSQRIFYTYEVVFEGFAASLTRSEASRFTDFPGVVHVREASRKFKLDTTHSAEFLGLNKEYGLWPDSRFGEDVIIGLVDTGIWPESESFDDQGLGPIPAKWKGSCQDGTMFNSIRNCNRKLIGAKFFLHGSERYLNSSIKVNYDQSPRDGYGHGSHTASTAAGVAVHGANIFGFANGTARGVAPKARIAMYKACSYDCWEPDILAAIESAVKDGVDVLSISIGFEDVPYYEDVIAIGTFAAMRKNIFVACSAGNGGPSASSLHNTAPWFTTVGAGSMDRTFPVEVHLGNNMSLVGSSLYGGEISNEKVPLLFVKYCYSQAFLSDVKGKIAICNCSELGDVRNGFLVQKAGGYGLIQLNFASDGEFDGAVPYIVPSATLGYADSLKLISYIDSTKNPIASFRRSRSTVVGENRAPVVMDFSSRGPSRAVPEILKPDIVAPGLDILAAWPPNLSPTRAPEDPRRVKFNTDSGTSMSCPHVAGLAALLRAIHPDWSPAAIRSALMTTATTVDNQYRSLVRSEDVSPATPFSVGAGHVHPQQAADPGLFYDAGISDYISFLCSLNYTKKQMRIVTGGSSSCTGAMKSPGDLNYPSFSVVFNSTTKVHEFRRTLTHVGSRLPEVYMLKVVNPNAGKVTVTLKPEKLLFEESSTVRNYTVKFESNHELNSAPNMAENVVFGSISWESNLHVVRSPFAIMWDK